MHTFKLSQKALRLFSSSIIWCAVLEFSCCFFLCTYNIYLSLSLRSTSLEPLAVWLLNWKYTVHFFSSLRPHVLYPHLTTSMPKALQLYPRYIESLYQESVLVLFVVDSCLNLVLSLLYTQCSSFVEVSQSPIPPLHTYSTKSKPIFDLFTKYCFGFYLP